MPVDDYPPLFSASDKASIRAQRLFFRLVTLQLFVLVVVAVLGTVSTVSSAPLHEVLVTISAVLLALGVLPAWFLRFQRPERLWFQCRAIAESVKTATWRYAMQVAPFGHEHDVGAADGRFVETLAEIRQARPGVERHLANLPSPGTEITDFMRDTRLLGFHQKKELYLRERVLDQISWYERKAVANRSASNRWLTCIIGIQVAALTLSLAHIAFRTLPLNVLPLLMTLASSSLAWMQARRYEELSEPYALAAQELRELASLFPHVKDEPTLFRFVGDVEEAISREHTMWRARRNTP